MPYDEGLAPYEIGRHLPTDDPGRQDHLSRARDIFHQLEAVYDLAQVDLNKEYIWEDDDGSKKVGQIA